MAMARMTATTTARNCDAWCHSRSSGVAVPSAADKRTLYKYMWTVDNFPQNHPASVTHEIIIATSSKFQYNDQTWYLDLCYVKPRTVARGNYHVRLNLDTPMMRGFIRCQMEHKFYIINRSGQEVRKHVGVSDFSNETMKIDISGELGQQENLTSQDPHMLYFMENTHDPTTGLRFAMCCELKAFLTEQYEVHVPPNNIVKDLNHELLKTGTGADAKLLVRGENGEDTEQQFPVHSAILAVRSPVFQAMFSHDLEEKRKKEVVIVDATSATIRDMLQFIYTGTIEPPLTFDRALSLLPCADKYDLTHLKVMCEEVLEKELTNANAAAVLHIALLCKCTQLCNLASKFVVINNQNLAALLANYGSKIQDMQQLPQLIYELKVSMDNIEELLRKKK